jgi:hypothetical protein
MGKILACLRLVYKTTVPEQRSRAYSMKFLSSSFHVWEYLWTWNDHSFYLIQYGSFKKYACTTWLCYTKYTRFDTLPVCMNCTLGMYEWKVREINYESDLKLYEEPQCSVQKMILHLISGNKVL